MKNGVVFFAAVFIVMVSDCYGDGFMKRDRPFEITLSDMKGLIEKFSGIVGKKRGDAADALNGHLKMIEGTKRYLMEGDEKSMPSNALFNLVERVELTADETVELVIVYMTDTDGRLALIAGEMGKPDSFDIISPSLAERSISWKYRYSECHIINHRRVCFSVTEYKEGKRLESISISKADD